MSHAEPQFSTARKGYKPEEVEAFVATINGTIDELNTQLGAIQRDLNDAYDEAAEMREQLHAATSELEKANQELSVAREQEEALRMTLVSASRTKDEMLANAQLESENMVADATAEAEAIRKAARDEASRLEAITRQTQSELEQREASVDSDLRSRAETFETQLVAGHEHRLASIARLDELYQASSQQLAALLETAQREIIAGRRDLAEFEANAATADAPSVEVEAAPEPPAQPERAERQQSALDKVASLTEPPQYLPAESAPKPEPVATAHEDVSIPAAPEPRLDRAEPTTPPADSGDILPEADLPEGPEADLSDGTNPATDGATPTEQEPAEPEAGPGAADERSDSEASDGESEVPSGDSEAPVGEAELSDETKPSFYNRRSGQLPRLGDDKQRDTTSSMASLRNKI